MLVKVMYCKYVRKNGGMNSVCFDTDKKIFSNKDRCIIGYTFVEAQQSRDVDALRKALIADGYVESDEVWE